MRKQFTLIALLLTVIIITCGVLIYSYTREHGPELILTYAENQASDYPTTLGANEFARLVYQETNGRIKILVYDSAQLGSESEVIKQMRYGGIDFARVSVSQIADFAPEMNVLQLPFLYNSQEHMWRVLDGEIGEFYLDNISKYELIGLSWYDAGARNLYCSKKLIRRISDLEGMKVRVQESQMMSDMITELGAIPYRITYSDVYKSLERGIVDVAENNWPSYESSVHYEVAKYYTEDGHTRVPEIQICSKHIWDKLSDSDKEIIKKCAYESSLYERELWIKREEESKNTAIKNGAIYVEMSEEEKENFRNAVKPLYEKYCGEWMDIVDRIIELGK